jgi:hypothetical protein
MNEQKVKGDNCNIGFWVFFAALFAVLLVSVLANIWIRVINNLAFNYFGLNQESFFWTLLVALILTGIFIAYIFLAFDEDSSNALKSRIVGLNFGTAVNTSNISPDNNELNNDISPSNVNDVNDVNDIDVI